jgi:cysteinyl-tRNA synthetase
MSNQEKMSKSKGNLIDLDELIKEGISPLAYRYLCLSSHYRKQLIYGKEILDSASNSYNGLKNKIKELGILGEIKIEKLSPKSEDYLSQFKEAIFNDLNTPQALAVLWSLLRDEEVSNEEKYFLSCDFDRVFALGIKIEKEEIPKEIEEIAKERETFRKEKNWKKSDELRDLILEKGYKIIDGLEGYRIEKVE